MSYLWTNAMPKTLKGVTYDSFLRLQIHNRQRLLDAAALKHYKPPATHWNEFIMATKVGKLLHPWIMYAAQRALVSTVAVLPSMNLRAVSIQHAQKILYNLVVFNIDYIFLKKHNKENTKSLLGIFFKTELAQCTDMDSIHALVRQEMILSFLI